MQVKLKTSDKLLQEHNTSRKYQDLEQWNLQLSAKFLLFHWDVKQAVGLKRCKTHLFSLFRQILPRTQSRFFMYTLMKLLLIYSSVFWSFWPENLCCFLLNRIIIRRILLIKFYNNQKVISFCNDSWAISFLIATQVLIKCDVKNTNCRLQF